LNQIFTIEDVRRVLADRECEIVGNAGQVRFDKAKPLREADEKSIGWIAGNGRDAAEWAEKTRACLLICKPSLRIPEAAKTQKCFILTKNPKLLFSLVVGAFFVERPRGVHPTAFVHPEAQIDERASIGAFSYVGKCKIGAHTIVSGHCYLHDNVTIGANVEIHAGCILGDDGSGYAKNDAGEWIKFPHIGGLVIEDHVEVGANTYINKGALGNTHIKRGAKIGNAVCIGHNVVIGENAIVIANSLVCGSAKVGEGVYIAPSAVIRNKLKIGDNATVGMGAVVLKDVPENTTVIGNPAMNMSEYRAWAKLKKKLFAMFGKAVK